MPADSLTTRRANRYVCCPLIFIELFPEQLSYNRHDVTSRKNRLLLRRAGRDLLCSPPSELFGAHHHPGRPTLVAIDGMCTRPSVKLA